MKLIYWSGLAEAVSSPRTDHHLTRTRYVRRVFLIDGSILKTEASDSQQVQGGPREKLECRHEICISAVCIVADGHGS